ncbi:TonB-dependent receptor [Mucilaginibacter sp. JRF]|uniref:TonB-dependent receptor n=1 Tax=Mucilaginibacter sp. JRF TaxID=2780088 RepID=UPI0018817F59|nr:TonB-dependent receptor [Mucilaginibacter sp. JRF]MBE9584083.1 TonB-dependent receptor [Mucilaginibacter sp. JRF]
MHKIALNLLLLCCTTLSLAQSRFTVNGTVTDKKNGETMIGATVYALGNASGTATNAYGFYSLTLPAGTHQLVFRMVGYQNDTVTINLTANVKLNHALADNSTALTEVVVTSKKDNDNIREARIGVEKLTPASVAKIPVIFGEKDIIKTIQLLPGVKSAGEGGAGFFVRGGAADQNLILLDEAPVYNASHLLGFFSTFNSDALKDVTLIKGNSPAQYGGRLSSVLDVKMKDGSNQKFNGSAGIGLISSRASFEGPIAKDRGSFIISARRTYVDMFLKLSEEDKDNKLYFYDLNAKASYRINDKNRIFFSGYMGQDVLGFGKTFLVDWGNRTATLRWNYEISPKLFSNTSFIYSNYNYKMNFGSTSKTTELRSKIQDVNLKEEMTWYLNTKNTIKFGFNVIKHNLIPTRTTTGNTVTGNKKGRSAYENALFVNRTWLVTDRLTIDHGVRFSFYTLLGGDTYRMYNNGIQTDSVVLASGKTGKTYINPEPRVQFNYTINDVSAIKGGYARNSQHLHLLSNSTSSSPTDQWFGDSYNVKPEVSDQFSLGYSRNFNNSKYQTSVEVYYKDMKNQIDYKDGADINTSRDVESELLFGKGRAYGAEFLVKKTQGRFTGWVGYTLSKTERQINGINNNRWYNARQDRTHDISVVGVYDLSAKWSLSGLFVYGTGNPVTYPKGKYQIGDKSVFIYTDRNGDRLPAYHRMDLGATYTKKTKRGREVSWNFSLYNAYGRANAYTTIFEDHETDKSRTVIKQTSLFRFVPSVTYNFKF